MDEFLPLKTTFSSRENIYFIPPRQSDNKYFVNPILQKQSSLENGFYTITVSTWETMHTPSERNTQFYHMVTSFLKAFNSARTIKQMTIYGFDFCQSLIEPEFNDSLSSINGKVVIKNILDFFTLLLNVQSFADNTHIKQKITIIKDACYQSLLSQGIQKTASDMTDISNSKERIKAVFTLIKNKSAKYLKFKRPVYWDEYYKKRGQTSTKYFETEEEQDANRVIISHGKFLKISMQGTMDKERLAVSLYDTTHEVADDFPSAKGKAIFALSVKGNIYSGSKVRKIVQHSSFVAGAPVIFAGIWQIEKGRLINVLNYSGHYPSSLLLMFKFLKRISDLGIEISDTQVRRIYQVHDTRNLAFIAGDLQKFRQCLINTKSIKELHGQFSKPLAGEIIINFGSALCRLLNTYGVNFQTKQSAIIQLLFYAGIFNAETLRRDMHDVGFSDSEIKDAIFIFQQALRSSNHANSTGINCAYLLENLFQNDEDNWPAKTHMWLIKVIQRISQEIKNIDTDEPQWIINHHDDLTNIFDNLIPNVNGIVNQTCFDNCANYIEVLKQLSDFYTKHYACVANLLGAKIDSLQEVGNLAEEDIAPSLPIKFYDYKNKMAELLMFSLQYHIGGNLSIFMQNINFGIYQGLILQHVRNIKRNSEQLDELYKQCIVTDYSFQSGEAPLARNKVDSLTAPLLNYLSSPYIARIRAVGLFANILSIAFTHCNDAVTFKAILTHLFFLYDYMSSAGELFDNKSYSEEKNALLKLHANAINDEGNTFPLIVHDDLATNSSMFFNKIHEKEDDSVIIRCDHHNKYVC